MHLRLDLYYGQDLSEYSDEVQRLWGMHAQQAMKELGITYQKAVPKSLGDCWWFWNCDLSF